MAKTTRHARALVALSIVLSPALVKAESTGVLDPSFGTGGKVITDFGGYEGAAAAALQPDGKLVAVGTTNINWGTDLALARYNSDGTLDTSFGAGGKVTLNFGPWDSGTSVAVQQDGKIVIAGGANNVYNDFGLARYNSDGKLDASFGTGGQVTTQFFGPQFGRASATAEAIAVQQDGKIVLAGEANIDGGESFALARYNSDGTLDASFGAGGQVTTDFGTLEQGFSWAFPESLALQADGKIVVAGYAFIGQSEDFALVRYNVDGTLDASFGTGGKVTNDFSGTSDMASAVAVQPDGRIVVAGMTARRKFTLVRYDNSGTLDPSFGTGGKVTTDFGLSDSASSLALQENGKILAGGRTYISGENFQPAMARYNADGTLDAIFGTGGKLLPDFGGSRPLVQPDGKIVTVGGTEINGDADFALARYQ